MNFFPSLAGNQFLFKFLSVKTSYNGNAPTINKKFVLFPLTFIQE